MHCFHCHSGMMVSLSFSCTHYCINFSCCYGTFFVACQKSVRVALLSCRLVSLSNSSYTARCYLLHAETLMIEGYIFFVPRN